MGTKNPTAAFDGQSTQASEINNFLSAQWRLPYFAADLKWKYHRGYMDASGNGVGYALRWLGTKVGFVDPVITHEIPSDVQSLLRGLIHIYRAPKAGFMTRQWNKAANTFDDSRAEDFLTKSMRAGATRQRGFADWFKLGLIEPKLRNITIKKHGLETYHFNEARTIRFVADVPYELVLYVGRGPEQPVPAAPPDKNVIAHGLVKPNGEVAPVPMLRATDPSYNMGTSGVRWFKIGLYVPDATALWTMHPGTRNYYLRITGRARGEANYNRDEDIYWHLSGWERALEAAKIPGWAVKQAAVKAVPGAITKGVGLLTGTNIPIDKASGPRQNWRHEQAMQDDGAGSSEAGPATYARAMWYGEAHDFNRKSIVPPNFCFVKFNCVLFVKVVVNTNARL